MKCGLGFRVHCVLPTLPSFCFICLTVAQTDLELLIL